MSNQVSRFRAGFTIIELMVAMALTLFIMVILSQAFILALDVFSGLKGIGDMQQNLRSASTVLRSDLDLYHFEGTRRLSDLDIATNPPAQGFFMVYQGAPSFMIDNNGARAGLLPNPSPLPTSPGINTPNLGPTSNPFDGAVAPNTYEGIDVDGVHSYTAVNHVLYFTSRQTGNGLASFYRTSFVDVGLGANLLNRFPVGVAANVAADATLTPAPAAAPVFGSPWGEISYFLLQTGSTIEPENPASTIGTPLYGLYRALYVVLTNTTGATLPAPAAAVPGINQNPATGIGGYASAVATQNNFAGISCNPAPNNVAAGMMDFYTPNDLANAQQPWPVANPVGVPRPTRTLPMVTTPGFAKPAVPPSLKWWTAPSGNVLLVPKAVNDQPPLVGLPPRVAMQVLPNVLSFHVQIMPKPDPRFTAYPYFTDPEPQFDPISANGPANPAIQASSRLYDTGAYWVQNPANPAGAPIRLDPINGAPSLLPAATGLPARNADNSLRYPYGVYNYPILAIQVTLRVWDPRSQQARQLTIVQDL